MCTNKLASYLASFGFLCFLAGRFTGAGLFRKYSAHQNVGTLWRHERFDVHAHRPASWGGSQ